MKLLFCSLLLLALYCGAAVHPVKTLPQSDAVMSLCFSPDGKLLAAGTNDGRVVIVSIPAFRQLANVKQGGCVRSLAFSRDSRTLYSASSDLYARESRTGALRRSWHFAFPVRSLALSPNGNTLAVGFEVENDAATKDANGRRRPVIVLMNTRSQHSRRAIPEYGTGYVASLAFSPDGRILAAGAGDEGDLFGGFQMWNAASGRSISDGGDEEIWDSIAFSRNGRMLATGSWVFEGGGRIVLRNPRTGRLLTTLDKSGDWTYALAFSPDGRLLASSHMARSGANVVKVRDIRRRRLLWSDTTPNDPYVWRNAVAISPDGKWLAFGGEDEQVRIWSLDAIRNAGHVAARARRRS